MHEVGQVTPQGEIHLLAGVPFNNSYKHTRYFNTVNDQTQYFLSKSRQVYLQATPVRPGVPLRIPVPYNIVYSCNYLMFQNQPFGSKWFYAFITSIRWVSVNSCEIEYELDILQSWWFDFRFQSAFIVREHSKTDTPGDNLVPENLELGEYTFGPQYGTNYFNGYSYLVAATVNKQGNDAVGGNYSGIYSGLEYNVFDTPSAVNAFIDSLTTDSKGDAIVSITMYPKEFTQSKGSAQAKSKTFTRPKENDPNTPFGAYTPKNNKLYTYPYNFLFVTNAAGSYANFPYEFFGGDNCTFNVSCDMSPNPTALCVPLNFKNVAENFNEKITLDGFPQCPWTTDTYKAWLAQNGSSTAISTMGSAFSAAANLMTLNFGGVMGNALTIAQTVAKVKATEALPPQAHGAAGNSVMVANNNKDFYFYRCMVTPEFAEIIDNYFSMYGYAIHQVKQPEFNSRLFWNHVETRNAQVTGSVPNTAARSMEDILNAGITFWHDDQVGYYNRLNPIRMTT